MSSTGRMCMWLTAAAPQPTRQQQQPCSASCTAWGRRLVCPAGSFSPRQVATPAPGIARRCVATQRAALLQRARQAKCASSAGMHAAQSDQLCAGYMASNGRGWMTTTHNQGMRGRLDRSWASVAPPTMQFAACSLPAGDCVPWSHHSPRQTSYPQFRLLCYNPPATQCWGCCCTAQCLWVHGSGTG